MSERILLGEENLAEAVQKAADVLGAGGVILYPTDTLYGLGADAFSDAAVDKVIAIKGRNQRKAIHCVVADMEMAAQYADITNDARLLARAFFPGALTLVLKKKDGFEHGIGRHRNNIGIRIPDNAFCLALAGQGIPFTTTSANTAGKPDAFSIDDILRQLGSAARDIGLIIDAGYMSPRMGSTVVDLSGEEPFILREGAIEAADIWNIIRAEP